MTTPPLKRRWFQFSLRSLLLLMLVVSMGLAWVMKERRRIAERREALAKMGFSRRGSQPDWHLKLFGDDWPGSALQIYEGNTNVTDAGLVHLAGLTQLQDLWLGGTQVTDAGLLQLNGLTQLEVLELNGTKVTDAGMVHLTGLTQLQRLWLYDTQVTDDGIAELQKALPNCKIYR